MKTGEADRHTRLEAGRAGFFADFAADRYHVVNRERQKIHFCRRGLLAWGWRLATEPS